jgi:competence protein ComGF
MNLQALIAISDLSLTSNSSLDAVPLLADQHQQDRSMMNLTLDFMQQTARESKDAIASKTTSMLRLLLSMEKQDDTFRTQHNSDSTRDGIERGIGCEAQITDCDQSLQIHIPCFGTIKLICGNAPELVPLRSLPSGRDV